MKMMFKDAGYTAVVWRPDIGRVADVISYDTETTFTDDPSAVPEFVIASVFDGAHVHFIRRQDLGAFWQAHTGSIVYFHTASFDIEVTTAACGFDFHPMIEAGLIRDISIYYRLERCATAGDVPHKFNLGLMCSELLGVALDKADSVRLDFGRFYRAGGVNYKAMPASYLEYAALDAITTYQLGLLLEERCRYVHGQHTPLPQNGINGTNDTNGTGQRAWGLLGHDIQLRGDIALRQIERYGIRVDAAAVEALDNQLAADSARHRAVLATYGYIPGAAGNAAIFDKLIGQIEQERGVVVAVTPKSGKKTQAANDLAAIADHPFVASFLQAKEVDKLRTTYVRHLRDAGGVVHPRYTLLVRTGRTSCSRPNIQNQPRAGGIRECFIPTPGYVFISCDYSMLELCTLAQITYTRFGRSAMRELINQGVDLHRRVAAQILGKPESDVTKGERQKAKAVGFGLPGGMSPAGLSLYARAAYGVDLPLDEAVAWRAAWLGLFPEMQDYLAHGDDLQRLGEMLDLSSYPDASPSFREETAAAIVLRVAGGASGTSAGRSFSPAELEWAWGQIADGRAGTVKALADNIKSRRGSRDLQRAVMPRSYATIPTGRVRADCSYTECKNGPFQGLAADGAKLALYDLMRAGYRVVAFVHDEVLVEVPKGTDYRAVAADISRIMIESMRQVCPDVQVRTEYAVMRRWRKDAKAAYDEQGRLIPYEDSLARKNEIANIQSRDPQPHMAALTREPQS